MAFPTIPTAAANTCLTSTTAVATTAHIFPSLTTLDNAAGDLLLAVIVQYNSGNAANAEFSGWSGGFTEISEAASATNAIAMGCAYKISDGTETGTFTVTSTGAFLSAQCLISVKGWHGTTVPEVAFSGPTVTTAQDPPNLDPSWSAASENTLWIAVAGGGQTSLTGSWGGITSAPASYTGYVESAISGGDAIGACQIAVAFRQLNGTAENPGAFTTDTSPEIERAATIAVRAAPVTGTAAGAALGSGTAAATVEVPATAAGAATSSGTAAGTASTPTMSEVFGVAAGAAVAAGTSAATVGVLAVGAATASASGTAVATVNVPATAVGVAAASGTGTATVEVPATAAGAATSSGTAMGTVPGAAATDEAFSGSIWGPPVPRPVNQRHLTRVIVGVAVRHQFSMSVARGSRYPIRCRTRRDYARTPIRGTMTGRPAPVHAGRTRINVAATVATESRFTADAAALHRARQRDDAELLELLSL